MSEGPIQTKEVSAVGLKLLTGLVGMRGFEPIPQARAKSTITLGLRPR